MIVLEEARMVEAYITASLALGGKASQAEIKVGDFSNESCFTPLRIVTPV